jgi:plasmid stability protein
MPCPERGCRGKNWPLAAGYRALTSRPTGSLTSQRRDWQQDRAINAINAIIDDMASITIRKLPENTKRRLRIRAARNGRSMEQEARELLEAGLAQADSEPKDIGEAIRRIFAPLGGVDLRIPPRGPIRDPGIR